MFYGCINVLCMYIGVMLSHGNVLRNVINCTYMTRGGDSMETYGHTLAISWLPTFHDMGLIGFHISPMICYQPVIYFSPVTFVKNPLLWLDIITEWTDEQKHGYKYCVAGGMYINTNI